MIKGFEFQADGRNYACTVEARTGPKAEFWWWFSVSGDMQRYAVFQAVEGDTKGSVQERVLAFYNNRLYKLAQPTQRPSQWRKRETPAATPVVPAQPAPEKV